MSDRLSFRELACLFPTVRARLCAEFPVEFIEGGTPDRDVADALFRLADRRTAEGRRWAPSSGERHAVAFLLHAWNGTPGFDLHRAAGAWDPQHRAAFSAWAAEGMPIY